MDELKPCPWCKKIDLLVCESTDHGEVKRPYGYRFTAKISCLRCAVSKNTHGFHQTAEEAVKDIVEAWNRRANDED